MLADKRDYYEVMGVPKGASDDEIKNLVDILEGSLHRDIHDVETSEETEKSSEKMTDEEIAELTRRFLEGAD